MGNHKMISLLFVMELTICIHASPVLDYATYLGGRGNDQGRAAVVDANGCIYIAGLTASSDLPATPGAYSRDSRRSMFVAKLSPDGSRLEYLTYFGGCNSGYEFVQGIAVDKEGCVYLAGNTKRSDFPTTPGAYDESYNGSANQWHGDGFVTKLSADGSALVYSTFIGGSGAEVLGKIAVDEQGCAYACFMTSSTNFPTTQGAYDRSYNGGEGLYPDSGVIKLSADGSTLLYATYLGGSIGEDSASAIKVDHTGCAIISGTTSSPDFPVTDQAYDPNYNGGESDVFIVKLNPDGSDLIYSTFLGGSGYDGWGKMVLDVNDRVYIAVQTKSADFPVTNPSFYPAQNSAQDIGICILCSDGSDLAYAARLGGSGDDSPGGIGLDSLNNLILAGDTTSRDFPLPPDANEPQFQGSSDLFLCQLDTSLGQLSYATLLGGTGQDVCMDLAVDPNDNIWIAGFTNSTNFPVTQHALYPTYRGPANPGQWVGDAFAAKFSMNTYPEHELNAALNFMPGQSIPVENGENLAVADLDGDGDVDVFLACGVWNQGLPNRVYINQGDGTFIDSDQRLGNLNSFGVDLADLDNDGDIDAFVANGYYYSGNPNKVWLNNGSGQFTDSGQSLGHNNTGAVALADLDGDGDLDAFAANHPIWQNNHNVGGGHCVWFNDGQGRFQDSGQSLGNAESRSVSLGDIDTDGDLDALIGNYKGYGNKLWLNDSNGYFTASPQVLGTVESRQSLLADLDRDGDLDAFVTHLGNDNTSQCPNKVWLNQGDGTFQDSGQRLGQLPSAGLDLGDLDLDGDLDAFVINSVYQGTYPDEVWLNDGQGHFTNTGLDLGNEESRDVSLADLDGDSDLDALVLTASGIQVFLNIREYLALVPPGNTPELFGPGIVSTEGNNEHTCSFSPDGRELFFTRDPERTTYTMKLENGIWTSPQRAHFTGREALFTPDGNKLYYNDGDIWVTERTAHGWTEPNKVPYPISSAGHDYYASFTSDGTMYFSRFYEGGQARIYRSHLNNGRYDTIEDVGSPVNHPTYNCYHPFVAPDESYLIFNSFDRPDGHGGADLYICYRSEDGTWQDPINMGSIINSSLYDLCPVVTVDGKYLFFTRYQNGEGNIYWVSAQIIQDLKQQDSMQR